MVWLLFIGMTEFVGLIISLYEGWILKIRLSKMDYLQLKRKLIEYKILAYYWDLNQFLQEIGISTKKKYIKT